MSTSSVVADLKKNTLYLPDQLKGVRVELKTDDGKFLNLRDFLSKALDHIMKTDSGPKAGEVPNSTIGTLIGLDYIPMSGLHISPPVLRTFMAAFQIGMLFERLRVKRELKLTKEEFELNAAEMDAILGSSGDSDADSEE